MSAFLCLLVRFAEEACSVIMSDVFTACHFLVKPEPFQRFCRYDVCACADSEECLCSALSAYAAACAARGVLLSWRSHSLCGNPAWQHFYLTTHKHNTETSICATPHTAVEGIMSRLCNSVVIPHWATGATCQALLVWCFPEMECTGGQVYETCGSVCERTCRSLSGVEPGCKGEKACEEGCFCPAGKYLSDSGECVTAELCTCLHDGQLYQPNDIYVDHTSIWSVTVACSETSGTDFMCAWSLILNF